MPDRFFVGTDLNLYYQLSHPTWYKRPDWFAVLGVPRLYHERDLRLSYVMWQEGPAPYVVVELLSPSTEHEDLGHTDREPDEPPTKWTVYEQILRIPYYVVFSRYTDEAHYFELTGGQYREIQPAKPGLWLPKAGVGMGLWFGTYQGLERQWLRCYDASGAWILTPHEQEQQRAEQEQTGAEQERQRRAGVSARRARTPTRRASSRTAQSPGDQSRANRAVESRKATVMTPHRFFHPTPMCLNHPDLWTTRIDAAFRDRAPRMQRINGVDQLVVEEHQVIAGIGLISNAGARFEAPETISSQGRFEDVHQGGYDPEQHLKDMQLDGVAGEILYPSQGLFYFKVADTQLMSAIFRAYNDWLAEFCRTDPERLKGIAMINLDDVQDGIKELERTAKMGFAGAMITEYPLEDRRYDQPEYEPFWAAAQAFDMPLSLHTATRRQGKSVARGRKRSAMRAAGPRKSFYPATSMCDMIFSGVFERYPNLKLAIVEFELAWVPHLLSTMDYTYRERHEEALYRFKDGWRR